MSRTTPPRRPYYSERTGQHPTGGRPDAVAVRRLFAGVYERMDRDGYFIYSFGERGGCLGHRGNLRLDQQTYMIQALKRDISWPPSIYATTYSDVDLFDVVEAMHDVLAEPVDEELSSSCFICGSNHPRRFDVATGQAHYREEVNAFLVPHGYELTPAGEVLALAEPGLQEIFEAPLPTDDEDNVARRVQRAITKYRQHSATLEMRREAVRELADVLEYLRPQIKDEMLSGDEADLFQIANKFGIRHHNEQQKTDYSPEWLAWVFYLYLATIHLILRISDPSHT